MDWYEHYEASIRALARVEDGIREEDWIAALRWLGKTNDHYGHVAIALAQRAYDGGATKKSIALALDVPASTLRGMQKT
jgi:hypothetical protein